MCCRNTEYYVILRNQLAYTVTYIHMSQSHILVFHIYSSFALAGGSHTVLIRSDGAALAFGHNGAGQCNLPDLPQERSSLISRDEHKTLQGTSRKRIQQKTQKTQERDRKPSSFQHVRIPACATLHVQLRGLTRCCYVMMVKCLLLVATVVASFMPKEAM